MQMQMIQSESVRLMPQCALCNKQACRWVTDTVRAPHIEVALCPEHGSLDDGAFVSSLEAVRTKSNLRHQ